MTLPAKIEIVGLNGIALRKGSHNSREHGVCAMEAVSWLAGEEHSDRPSCSCPVIGSFIIGWNDRLGSDAERDRLLKPLLPYLIGTNDPKLESRRRDMIRTWSRTVALPKYLEAAKLYDHAETVAAAPSDKNVAKAREAAWSSRSEYREKIRTAVREAVKKNPAAADAAVAAVAAAAAAAAADAAAADAAVAAVAAAAVVAAADAAVAAVVADAVVAGWGYGTVYSAVYTKLKEHYQKVVAESEVLSFVPELQASAQQLVRDLCALSSDESVTEAEVTAVCR